MGHVPNNPGRINAGPSGAVLPEQPIVIHRVAVLQVKQTDALKRGPSRQYRWVADRRTPPVNRARIMRVTIAGDGPLLPELRSGGGDVACTGWLDAPALKVAMRQARALVFPSTWYETCGLVVLEALAQGIPVIVSRNTGAADFVEHGANGLLVEPGDAQALRAAMTTLNDPQTAARTGSANFTGTGNSLANAITGGSGSDTINGGAGNDTIDGGAGMDSLTGGTGNDVFVFTSGQANGDTVTDFAPGSDHLQFSGFGPGSTFTQMNATDWVITDGIDHHAETIHFTNHPTLHAADYAFI